MRNNIAFFEKTSSSEVKLWAKVNAKLNSALIFSITLTLCTMASFLKRRNIISHLFAS